MRIVFSKDPEVFPNIQRNVFTTRGAAKMRREVMGNGKARPKYFGARRLIGSGTNKPNKPRTLSQ
ncbi:hypothetical protein PHLCEN_2v3729 [Hermanssonia centrifuga]|uniref:Uncharacterized protein n=1 Tax=Hermanssonia centrifuga TaxID=98765 RepID=A0A2R6QBP2_9APHY|nr:hypothetical protein PHLCEN_2v3729 [Hermanssonia centrifuga]